MIDIAQFKIRGMSRDNSESAFSPEFAYENMNMRVDARTEGSQLSLQNEKGNSRNTLQGLDGGMLDIKGTPIGYATIGDELVIFTTENRYRSALDVPPNSREEFYINKLKFKKAKGRDYIFSAVIGQGSDYNITDKLVLEIYYFVVTTSESELIKFSSQRYGILEKYNTPSDGVEYILLSNNIADNTQGIIVSRINVCTDKLKKLASFEVGAFLDKRNQDITIIESMFDDFPSYSGFSPAEDYFMELGTEVYMNSVGPRLSVINGEIYEEDGIYKMKSKDGYKNIGNYYRYDDTISHIGTVMPTISINDKSFQRILGVFEEPSSLIPITSISARTESKIHTVGDIFTYTVNAYPMENTDTIIVNTSSNLLLISKMEIPNGIKAVFKCLNSGSEHIAFSSLYGQAQVYEYITINPIIFNVASTTGNLSIQLTSDGINISNNIIQVTSNYKWQITIPDEYIDWILLSINEESIKSEYDSNATITTYSTVTSIAREGYFFIESLSDSNTITNKFQVTVNQSYYNL